MKHKSLSSITGWNLMPLIYRGTCEHIPIVAASHSEQISIILHACADNSGLNDAVYTNTLYWLLLPWTCKKQAF